jgi:hypothetical protein
MQVQPMAPGTRPQIVGKFTLYIKPDGSLIAMTGNQHLLVSPDEARGLFDYILQYARYFEQANNGHVVNTETLAQPEGQEKRQD